MTLLPQPSRLTLHYRALVPTGRQPTYEDLARLSSRIDTVAFVLAELLDEHSGDGLGFDEAKRELERRMRE